jgi:hypothetical protein
MSICNYCGRDNAELAQFCEGCGTDLRPAPPASAAPRRVSHVNWKKTFFTSSISSVVLYPIAVFIDYQRIREYYQTPHIRQSLDPNFGLGTGGAWIHAAFQCVLLFVVVFIIGAFVFKKRGA